MQEVVNYARCREVNLRERLGIMKLKFGETIWPWIRGIVIMLI